MVFLATTVIPAPVLGDDGFSDVPEGGTHEPAIEALAEMGVFEGTKCGDGLFCPRDPVERWVMAVWLIRALGGEVTTTGTSRFADVDAARWWSPHAEELADREITKGCATGPLRYCPNNPVTRAQMATFLVGAFDLDSAPPAGFTDTEGNIHQDNIDALAAAQITAGCRTGPLRYCPNAPVTRAQMATFLHRALLRQKEQAVEADTIVISDDVPDIDLANLSTGESVNLRSIVTGDKALLLWFWSPYCPTCSADAPMIEQFARQNSHRVTVIGINGSGASTDVKAFMSHFGITFTNLQDRSPWATRHYGIEYWSQFWLLDRLGNRIGNEPALFSTSRVEDLLAELEA